MPLQTKLLVALAAAGVVVASHADPAAVAAAVTATTGVDMDMNAGASDDMSGEPEDISADDPADDTQSVAVVAPAPVKAATPVKAAMPVKAATPVKTPTPAAHAKATPAVPAVLAVPAVPVASAKDVQTTTAVESVESEEPEQQEPMDMDASTTDMEVENSSVEAKSAKEAEEALQQADELDHEAEDDVVPTESAADIAAGNMDSEETDGLDADVQKDVQDSEEGGEDADDEMDSGESTVPMDDEPVVQTAAPAVQSTAGKSSGSHKKAQAALTHVIAQTSSTVVTESQTQASLVANTQKAVMQVLASGNVASTHKVATCAADGIEDLAKALQDTVDQLRENAKALREADAQLVAPAQDDSQDDVQETPGFLQEAPKTKESASKWNKIAPFGAHDTAHELQNAASKSQDTLVDAIENAQVAEIKRAIFRSLTRLRAATVKEYDTIARLETQAMDAYNDGHNFRAENPITPMHSDEAPVPTDKLKSFH